MIHTNLQHGDILKGKENKKPKQTQIELSHAKAKCFYSWLNWVCLELQPFSFADSELTQKYSLRSPISKKTLQKLISKQLLNSFALLFDGWTHHSTH